MANTSVNEITHLINQQIDFHETIESYLHRLETLLLVPKLITNFFELPDLVLQNYFALALELIGEAKQEMNVSYKKLIAMQHI